MMLLIKNWRPLNNGSEPPRQPPMNEDEGCLLEAIAWFIGIVAAIFLIMDYILNQMYS